MINIENFIRLENQETATKIAIEIEKLAKEMEIAQNEEDVKTLAVGFASLMLYYILFTFYLDFKEKFKFKENESAEILLDLVYSITEGLGIREKFVKFFETNKDYKLNEKAVKFSNMLGNEIAKAKIVNIFMHLSDIVEQESKTVGDKIGCFLYLIKTMELEKDLVSISMLTFESFERNNNIKIYSKIEDLIQNQNQA